MEKDLKSMSNEELWQLFPILISEHTEIWKDMYKDKQRNLYKWIGNSAIYRINHIGSTIRGLVAKPTIDILLETNKNVDIEKLIKF